MAAESPRSYGSVDSYIGSLISLVSKSEIRYEGSLYQINTNESTLGLRNVRSFGTEGRKKDGTQIPQSDRIYDYIVFRGSDIKELQVKSSPPVLISPLIHNDPAIIQSDYHQAPVNTSFPLANSAPPPDLGAQIPQTGLMTTSFESNCSLYQPEVSSSSWCGPSLETPPVPAASATSSLYWQGHYGPSSTIQSPQQQQENLLQPPQPLSISCSSQQSVPRSSMNPHVPSLLSQSPDLQPALLLPLGSGALNTPPTMLSGQISSIISEPPASLLPSKFHAQALPSSMSQILDPPLVSPLPALESNTISVMPNQAKLVSNPMSISLYNGAPEKFAVAAGSSSNSPSLVTPGQFLQPGLSITLPSLQPLQIEQKEGKVVPIQSSSIPTPNLLLSTPASVSAGMSVSASSECQAPLLPLPSSVPKLSDSAINYGEDFDFEAMNEKFKKEQVGGHLGRSKDENCDDPQYTNDLEYPRVEIKPVYQKDDFFDTLSCNSIARHGRPRFSEQRKVDTETFGNFQKYWGGRGGRGPWRSGRLRGGYYGRGYGYVGRGPGGYGTYRGT